MIYILLFVASALCDDNDHSGDRKIIYKEKTEIDFEGLDVSSEIMKPQSSLVLERTKASFNPLIILRTDWNDKIEQDTDNIK